MLASGMRGIPMRTRSLFLAAMAASAACLVAQAQTPAITGLANNATPAIAGNAIAPGELVNINGSNLGDASSVSCGSPAGFTTSCGGVSVTVAGKAAGVRNAGASQVIIEVPVDAPAGNGQLVVTRAAGGQNLVSPPFAIDVVPYAPQLFPYLVNGVLFADCFNAANSQLSSANPAAPGDIVTCLGTGFGATNPVVPTGTIPPAPLPTVVGTVTVTLAGKNATVASATLEGPVVGEDQVIFVVPPGVPGGNQNIFVRWAGSTLAYELSPSPAPKSAPWSTRPATSLPGLPNAGIAQGAIFVVFGSDLGPANISFAPTAFQSTTLEQYLARGHGGWHYGERAHVLHLGGPVGRVTALEYAHGHGHHHCHLQRPAQLPGAHHRGGKQPGHLYHRFGWPGTGHRHLPRLQPGLGRQGPPMRRAQHLLRRGQPRGYADPVGHGLGPGERKRRLRRGPGSEHAEHSAHGVAGRSPGPGGVPGPVRLLHRGRSDCLYGAQQCSHRMRRAVTGSNQQPDQQPHRDAGGQRKPQLHSHQRRAGIGKRRASGHRRARYLRRYLD